MAGCWIEDRGEKWFEECWTAPSAGILIGSGRTGEGETLRSWEAMQIVLEPAGAMAFYGAPGGEGRTRFERHSDGEGGLTFVNKDHDYPQRVRYWREGEKLLAEVSLIDGSNAMRWTYRRQGAGE
ncbi:DUF6265 family protein [Tsuneonella sp. HG249]